VFLISHGFKVDEYKETLMKFNTKGDKPEKPEDEFKVDIFIEGEGEEIPDKDGIVVLYHFDLFAPDLNMKHTFSTRTDLSKQDKQMNPLLTIIG
jgi:hypothetical protein